MANIQKRANGSYTVLIRLAGYPAESETFTSLREAKDWAQRREADIKSVRKTGVVATKYTLGQAIDKYIEDIAPTHAGGTHEVRRLRALANSLPTARILDDFTPQFWEDWAAKRGKMTVQNNPSKIVSGATIRRELCDLSLVFKHARRKLRWITSNPFADVERPPSGESRSRLITQAEISAIFKYLNYTRGVAPVSIGQQVAAAFDLALETGLRSGEITGEAATKIRPAKKGLSWENVHLDKRYVHLPKTKNGTARDVPLRPAAVAILESLRGINSDEVFTMYSQTRDAYFRKARKNAGLEGFTFHDARHTAATSIAGTLIQVANSSPSQAILELCKIFGWKDPKYALVYFNPDIAELAARMMDK